MMTHLVRELGADETRPFQITITQFYPKTIRTIEIIHGQLTVFKARVF